MFRIALTIFTENSAPIFTLDCQSQNESLKIRRKTYFFRRKSIIRVCLMNLKGGFFDGTFRFLNESLKSFFNKFLEVFNDCTEKENEVNQHKRKNNYHEKQQLELTNFSFLIITKHQK